MGLQTEVRASCLFLDTGGIRRTTAAAGDALGGMGRCGWDDGGGGGGLSDNFVNDDLLGVVSMGGGFLLGRLDLTTKGLAQGGGFAEQSGGESDGEKHGGEVWW